MKQYKNSSIYSFETKLVTENEDLGIYKEEPLDIIIDVSKITMMYEHEEGKTTLCLYGSEITVDENIIDILPVWYKHLDKKQHPND